MLRVESLVVGITGVIQECPGGRLASSDLGPSAVRVQEVLVLERQPREELLERRNGLAGEGEMEAELEDVDLEGFPLLVSRTDSEI